MLYGKNMADEKYCTGAPVAGPPKRFRMGPSASRLNVSCPRPRSCSSGVNVSCANFEWAIKGQLARLKNPAGAKLNPHGQRDDDAEEYSGSEADSGKSTTDQRLEKLERLVQEMNEHLKSIEGRLPPPKQ